MPTNSYKDLIAWQKSIKLVRNVYLVTESLPTSEKFGLSNQLRRAAVSIPSNIAEGYGRNHPAERRQFLAQALGSARELETQLLIAKELGFTREEKLKEAEELLIEVLKMLYGLMKSIR